VWGEKGARGEREGRRESKSVSKMGEWDCKRESTERASAEGKEWTHSASREKECEHMEPNGPSSRETSVDTDGSSERERDKSDSKRSDALLHRARARVRVSEQV
jgi:hypothetical protein